ncbi:hypothetical protein P4234_29015 [Pseudomonas aeruginosa]|nr:hypothetical protein [Pseudomonas aeruginosa]
MTALCRWLARRGVAVVPFKPQNMALNSAVTADGGEIGRAQAVQAQACRLAPHTDMNPVLLAEHRHRRPGDHPWPRGDQHGRRRLPRLQARGDGSGAGFPWAARRRLPGGDGEGAGSPAEINLRANDIANMGFAEAVDCPVILVADIDRGGVFAHLVGTRNCSPTRSGSGSRASSSIASAATSPCCNPASTGWRRAPASRCSACCPASATCTWRRRTPSTHARRPRSGRA